jgi:hypothetical protein
LLVLTLPGTKKRLSLFDEAGQRIRGKENKEAAELALGRLKLSAENWPTGTPPDNAREMLRTGPRGSGVPLFRNPQGNRWLKPTLGAFTSGGS